MVLQQHEDHHRDVLNQVCVALLSLPQFLPESRPFPMAAQAEKKLVHRKRLLQEIRGFQLDGLNGVIEPPIIRHDDDFPPWILPLQRLGQLKARNAGNLNIHESQVEGVPPGYFKDILRRGAAERITAFPFEHLAHQPAERNIVVDDKHPFRSGHVFSYHGASGHAPPPKTRAKAFRRDGWKRTKPNWKIVFATTMVDDTFFILTTGFQMQTLK
jgi:hypothetical protein